MSEMYVQLSNPLFVVLMLHAATKNGSTKTCQRFRHVGAKVSGD
jgi:hypothetical protein